MIYYDPQGDWIFHEQGVKLVLELYNVGEPYADIIVKRYRKSDEVRYCESCMDKIPSGLSGFPFSKTYFLNYLERNPPGKRAAIKKQRRYVSASDIPGVVTQYLAGPTAPSMAGLVRHVRELRLDIPRPKLRVEYRRQRPNRRAGRPSKNNRPK